MAKRSRFSDALTPPEPPKPARAPRPARATPSPQSRSAAAEAEKARREGKRVITVAVNSEAHKQIKQLALDEDRQVRELVIEAINLLFQSRGKTRLAE